MFNPDTLRSIISLTIRVSQHKTVLRFNLAFASPHPLLLFTASQISLTDRSADQRRDKYFSISSSQAENNADAGADKLCLNYLHMLVRIECEIKIQIHELSSHVYTHFKK